MTVKVTAFLECTLMTFTARIKNCSCQNYSNKYILQRRINFSHFFQRMRLVTFCPSKIVHRMHFDDFYHVNKDMYMYLAVQKKK